MEGIGESREKFDRGVNLGVSRDPPENFTNRSSFAGGIDRKRKEDDEEEIELSLGLSLNGRFGLDPTAKRLKRSSSVSNLISTVDFFDNGSSSSSSSYPARGSYAPLARTSSLPAVSEEVRRRKELNSLKYMEARKKRMEKLKNGRVVKDKESSSEDVHTGSGLQDDVNEVEPKQASRGSAGSSAGSSSSSSGISDFPGQIMDAGTKTISSNTSCSSHQLPQDEAAQKPSGSAGKVDNKSLKNPLFDMPYVSTRGDGPNATKIEGFLYRYRKGDEVKIVCVCHGLFLTPAEFVKHGGGGDVAQPLKHIVVNPFPLF